MLQVKINNFENWTNSLSEEEFKSLVKYIEKRNKSSKSSKSSKSNYLDYSLNDLYLDNGKIMIKK